MRPQSRHSITPIIIATLIVLLAAGLRITTLGLNSVWWDEGFSVWLARQPLGQMLYQTAIDVHPPLYYLSLSGWRSLAGDSATALRLLTALWGIVAVALVYRVGRVASGSAIAGLIAALLVAVSPVWVSWSMELRMYGQSIALSALALLAAIKVLDERTRGTWRWVAILALAEAAGLLTLFLVAGAIVVMNAAALVVVIASRARWKILPRWGAAQAAALAIFLPWFLYTSRASSWQPAAAPIDLWFTLKLYLGVFLVGVEENIDQFGVMIAVAGIILVAAGAAVLAQRDRVNQFGAKALMLLGVILPPLLMFGLFLLPRSERFNIASPAGRYFLVMSIPIYVLAGWGIATAARRSKWAFGAAALIAAMLGWSLFARTYPNRFYVDDYASLSAALESMVKPGDTVMLYNDYEWPVFAYHYQGDTIPIAQERLRARGVARDMLRPVFESSPGIWLVQTPFATESDPDGFVPSILAARAERVDTYQFPQADLIFYALTPERAAESLPGQTGHTPQGFTAAAMQIAPGAAITGSILPPQPVMAGSDIGITVSWRVEEGSGGSWPAALKLTGADGAAIAETAITLDSPAPGDYLQPVTLFIPTFGRTGTAHVVVIAGENSAVLSDIHIRPTNATPPPDAPIPPTATRIDARFGDHVALLAADLPPEKIWKPGDIIPLTLYWSTYAPLAARYKGFVHLSGGQINPRVGSRLWGQDDHEPAAGMAPTTLWRPGATIRDDYSVQVAPNTPSGEYQLEVGLYLPLDLTNLLVLGPDGVLTGAYPIVTIAVER